MNELDARFRSVAASDLVENGMFSGMNSEHAGAMCVCALPGVSYLAGDNVVLSLRGCICVCVFRIILTLSICIVKKI